MSMQSTNWWERGGNFVPYPSLQQGDVPHCVYAAIAGGINHLAQRSVWTPRSLYVEYQKGGPKDAHFGVATPALVPVTVEIEKIHHHKDSASESLSPSLIREWITKGAVVILSMEQGDGRGGRQQRWHMFSLMALDEDLFQVWDTNGGRMVNGRMFEGRGFFTNEEIKSGFSYPNGASFMPHDKEDTLVLKRKK